MVKEDHLKTHITNLFQQRAGIILILGAFLFLSHGIMDYFVTPENFKIFLVYRLIIASLLIILYLLNRLRASRNYQYTILIIATVFSALTVELMILSFGGHKSIYHVGMDLIVISILVFIPINLPLSLTIIALVYAIYLFPILIFDKITDIPYFISSNVFMVSIFIVALAWRILSQKAIVNESKLHGKLSEEMSKMEMSVRREQRLVRDLAILNEMMSSISSELEFDTILQTFIEHARVLIKAEYCAIFIFEGKQKKITKFKFTVGKGSTIASAVPILAGQSEKFINITRPIRINSPMDETPIGNFRVENLIIVPLASADNKLSGLLALANKEGGFTDEDEDSLFNFSFQVFEVIALQEEISRLAITDGLTGLYNHRAFQERLSEEIERTKRYNRTLVLLMLDIDHFKSFNDLYGHQTGDEILKIIAKLIKNNIRSVDFAARYGGEEFMVILPEAGCEDAICISERIRLSIVGYPFTVESGEHVMITVSIGTICFPEDSAMKEDLLRKVDQALYFAKEKGRNMVCNYRDTLAGILEKRPEELENILKDPSFTGIKELAKAIDSGSSYMRGHSFEVAAYAMVIAKTLGLDNSAVEGLRLAGILHDVGNVTIPVGILNKPGPLTEEEKTIIKGHPGLADMILKKYPHTEEVLPTILYHHERYDGKGYPLGLKGDTIPLSARILSVAEAFQAMISSRPYRERLTLDQAIKELRENAGTQFDLEVVEAFIKTLKAGTNLLAELSN